MGALSSSRPLQIILLGRFLRHCAFGLTSLILVFFLKSLHYTETEIGVFMCLTLLGDVIISYVLALVTDKIGRRRIMIAGGLLMAGSGFVFAMWSSYWVFLVASVLGVINPSGHEIGPFKAVEESIIAQLVAIDERGKVLGWYYMLGGLGEALGMLLSGWIAELLQSKFNVDTTRSYRAIFMVYAAAGILKAILPLGLGSECEMQSTRHDSRILSNETQPLLREPNSKAAPKSSFAFNLKALMPKVSKESTSFIKRVVVIYSLSCIGASFVTEPWLVYFFEVKFSFTEDVLGSMFFLLNILCAVTNIFSGSLAKKAGTIPAMLIGHTLYSLSISLLPWPKGTAASVGLLVLRYATIDLGQAPRQVLISSSVLPEERTATLGLLGLFRTLAYMIGPPITGALWSGGRATFTFEIAGLCGLLYAFAVYILFWGYKTREERQEEAAGTNVPAD